MTKAAVVALAAAAVVVALVLAFALGRGGSSRSAAPHGDPVVFLEGVIGQIVRNDYQHAYGTLHPAQQRTVSKKDYVRCELQTPIIGKLDSITVVRAFDDRVLVPGGATHPVPSKVVTFRLRLKQPVLGTITFSHTVHAVAVDGKWRWILTPHRYSLYRVGGCSGAPSPSAPA